MPSPADGLGTGWSRATVGEVFTRPFQLSGTPPASSGWGGLACCHGQTLPWAQPVNTWSVEAQCGLQVVDAWQGHFLWARCPKLHR